jgi:hypothetical protein
MPMTVVRFLAVRPEERDKATFFFGVFPFPQTSATPYDIRLRTFEKRTSTLKIFIY